jgi:hypothetical protein
MNSRTGGIIGTIVAALLCGIPGIVLACMGLIAIVGGQSPEIAADSAKWQNTMIGAVAFLIGGAVLILIPLIVGFFSLRRRPTRAPMVPAAPRPAVTMAPAAVPSFVAPDPAPAATAIPAAAPQPSPIPAAPAAPVAQPAPAGMDASTQAVYERIIALNRPTAPYQILDGKAQNADLIAEWKIVDARWYEVFAKANLTKVFRIQMKLDPTRREVRAQDQEFNVSWKVGVPSLSFEASFFRGQKSSVSFGTGYAFSENLAAGQVYKYKFNTNELKKPIQDAVAACGWTYKGVAFGKL